MADQVDYGARTPDESEVRNLPQRSAAAAKEIKPLIDDSVSTVASGSRLVDDAGSTMQVIVDSIRTIANIMSEITIASVEQAAGIEQINHVIVQMDEVTQQNASLVEQAAAAANAIQDQSMRLVDVVVVFKTNSMARASTNTPTMSAC